MDIILDRLPGGAAPIYDCLDKDTEVLYFDGKSVVRYYGLGIGMSGRAFKAPLHPFPVGREEHIIACFRNSKCFKVFIVKDGNHGTGYFGIRYA